MKTRSIITKSGHFMKSGYRFMTYLLLSFLFVSVGAGCASMTKHEPHNIAKSDVWKVYHATASSDHHKTLTKKQSQLVNKLYGEDVSQEGDMIAYFDALRQLPPHYKTKVFLVHAQGESGQLDVIVGMRGRMIDRIVVSNSPGEGHQSAIPGEFLMQFIGRSLQDSWQVAEKTQDLIVLPSMIRPLTGHQKTSKDITSNIRKVLVWVTALELYYG